MQVRGSFSIAIQQELDHICYAHRRTIWEGHFQPMITQVPAGTLYTKTFTGSYSRKRPSFTGRGYFRSDNFPKGYYILVESRYSGSAAQPIVAKPFRKAFQLYLPPLLGLSPNPCMSRPGRLPHYLRLYTTVFQEYQHSQLECRCRWSGRL